MKALLLLLAVAMIGIRPASADEIQLDSSNVAANLGTDSTVERNVDGGAIAGAIIGTVIGVIGSHIGNQPYPQPDYDSYTCVAEGWNGRRYKASGDHLRNVQIRVMAMCQRDNGRNGCRPRGCRSNDDFGHGGGHGQGHGNGGSWDGGWVDNGDGFGDDGVGIDFGTAN